MSIVQTVNRAGVVPLAPTFSDLSIVPFPPQNPAVLLLRTAGQVGTPPPSSTDPSVPASFALQARYALDNVGACLAAGGATPRDVTKITIFVVGLDATMRQPLVDALTRFFSGPAGQHRPPSALVGVAALAAPQFLIEVEAEAAIAA